MILTLGDTHVDFNNMKLWIEYCATYNIDTIVQAGDLGYYPNIPKLAPFIKGVSEYAKQMGVTIYFVHGNHDNIADLYFKYGRYGNGSVVEIAPNLIWMPTGVPFELKGVRMMAVGGAWSIDGWKNIAGIDYFPEETLTYGDVMQASAQEGIQVMFTHDCPLKVDLRIDLHDEVSNNRQNLQDIVDSVKPAILFHGHYHWMHETLMFGDDYQTVVYGLASNKELFDQQALVLDPENLNVMRLDIFTRRFRLNGL